MQIDRSNYEIWFIDWLDGKLSDYQVEQIKLFLIENPGLKEDFEELTNVCLIPSDKVFPNKDHLKKTISNISESQFEYLCVAYLENDLSADHQAEIKESLEQDTEKKRTFELIQRIKLTPSEVNYKLKNQLIRRTPSHRFLRLSAIVLSAAASFALLIMTYFLMQRNLPDKINTTARSNIADSSLQNSRAAEASEKIITDKKPADINQKRENLFTGTKKSISVLAQPDLPATMPADSSLRTTGNQEIQVKKVPVFEEIDLKGDFIRNTLIASNTNSNIPLDEDDRSKLSRFIAKTFREKILKETSSIDSPLKGYEIAEAGVTGLNKLLGWKMALEKNNNENGELNSVHFSSKILKFNAPVKKREALQ